MSCHKGTQRGKVDSLKGDVGAVEKKNRMLTAE